MKFKLEPESGNGNRAHGFQQSIASLLRPHSIPIPVPVCKEMPQQVGSSMDMDRLPRMAHKLP